MFLGKVGGIGKYGGWVLALAMFLYEPLLLTGQAQQLTLRFVPSQTSISFTVADILHTIHGSFDLKSGDLRYDPNAALLRGSLVVDATSGRSGNRTRDRRMHGEILESARYPEIAFRADRVDGPVAISGASTLQVHGMVSIHGAEHELAIPVRVQIFPDHWVADSHFTIPYVKWGIKNPSRLLLRVSESVEIDFHASGSSP
ncbi:MAG: YceI family protein [Acidobacteria bacterium]|nr:YceI family protein [Acidobacteriota bacterium]